MSAPRHATIAFEHIEAEMAAFPLVSETSFRLGITSINPMVSRDEKLWRAAEKELIGALPSLSLDEAAAIRDKLWFDSSNLHQERSSHDKPFKTVSLVSYVRRLAESYLDLQGRPVEMAGAEADTHERAGPEGRLRWSWMCQAFPPDFLRVARRVVNPDANPFPLNPTIETMLHDCGFAETHLHLGAAVDFSLAWAALMRSLTKSESEHFDFESPGACFDDGRDLCCWVMYAAVARLVLAEWLCNGSPSESSSLDNLLTFSCDRLDVLDIVERHRLATILSDLRLGRWQEWQRQSFAAGRREHLAKRFAQTRAIYRRLIRPPDLMSDSHTGRRSLRALQKPETRHDVFGNDPLARVVGWRPTEGVSPETLFVEAALRRIEEDERKDDERKEDERKGDRVTDFARLFWQVMRVRCLLYRHVVQRPLTPGLQWFVRFFSRIKPLRKNLSSSVLASTAARITGEGTGLRSLEVRLGTDESEFACLDLIRNLERAALPLAKDSEFRFFRRPDRKNEDKKTDEKGETARFEVGGVFHFSRKRGGGWEAGKPNAFGLDHSFPGLPQSIGSRPLKDTGNPTGFRFARFYMEQRRHAQALVSLFQKYPLALRTVRGVDLCTDEAGVPVWVMAPLVRWVREAGLQAAIHLKRRGEFAIPPLRTSVHAGEDFVHLMAGLRRIDNTITYLGLEEGDRLGHALALGIDASAWCGSAGRVVQTHEERLFDLVWEWSCYAKHNVDVTPKRLAYVRTEIVRLARHIFEGDHSLSYTPEDLTAFWDLLHTERALRGAGFPDQPGLRLRKTRGDLNEDSGEDAPQWRRMLVAYLCDRDVWRKGRVLETIDLRYHDESAALAELQSGLQRRIGKLCLTIEVNPSSNLLIGDLIDFKNHPLWRMRPVATAKDACPLSVCIGSDNPLTFATTLPHEYQLLFDAIVLGEESNEVVARKWIDEVRDCGMRARFTLAPDVARLSQEELRVPNLMRMGRPGSPP